MARLNTNLTRNLILVLGDQLDAKSAAFDGFDAGADRALMAETMPEARDVWSSKPRMVMFLSTMRHFRDRLRRKGIQVDYAQLDDGEGKVSLSGEIERSIRRHRPNKLIVVRPGQHELLVVLQQTARQAAVDLEVRPDTSFLCTPEAFSEHADGRKQLRMEHFYRQMRKRWNVLIDADGRPEGGQWNFDKANRRSFGRTGPQNVPRPKAFAPDRTIREVIAAVHRFLPDHPGSLDAFDWPVTPRQAAAALADFVENRLPLFGDYEDAMWTDQPLLYHSRLSAAMNLKLLSPRAAIAAAEEAYRQGRAPLNAVEGFVRQVLGWREYVRGVYWRFMPDYLERNALESSAPLPAFYWTGQTEAACLRAAVSQTLELGYAHHIQRLMVTGLYALLLGVDPREVHKWYLAVYVDAVEWVELPNTLGMSQYADGGIMASKPYAASGKYIAPMSNYCQACRFRPDITTGEHACPFSTLYWDFLMRQEHRLANNPRMGLQLRNLSRLGTKDKRTIRTTAERIRSSL